ncbi:methyl-accepting chemotaxis protein [Enterocloster aldenensis]|uniref:methyl-accepting chemotaxis protein n=1 Tax=Enterocloster aldenensis TaxID=358742 RepID=UPI000E41D901|nr:methyl-accepting chemotaxis protein [Enterocloster aldenensis]
MRYRYKRIMTAGLAAVLLCTNAGGAVPAYGAEAAVDVDETMYINLDYYGRPDKINVVKGLNLNGRTEFTDYGTYLDVTNMSNQTVPDLGDGTVTWNFPQAQKERFYYKCALDKSQITLPWDFDVSYKLNGVPTDGDKLAGASGLVEINIKAEPNDNAGEYYRNNMMLMVAVPVDMGKCYSVEAEGSQTQNLGETTAVVFTALPGEDGDYTVRIGTDSFETTGVIMAMMPGTVEDLEHIKDLKEAKDTWQDAGDELYDSLEQMARSVEDMRQGVGQVRTGLDSAEIARQKWSNSKDSILAGNDQTLASLTSVSQQLETMIPHLQTAKESAEVIHKSMGDIVNTMGEMQDPLRKLHTRLNNIKSSAEGISGNIPELMDLMQQIIALDAQLQASEQVYVTGIATAGSGISLLDEEELEEQANRSHGNKAGSSGSGQTASGGADTGSADSANDKGNQGSQGSNGAGNTDNKTDHGNSQGSAGTDGKDNQGSGSTDGKDNQGSGSTDGKDNQGSGSTDGKDNQGSGSTDGKDNQGSGSADGNTSQGSGSAGGKDNQGSGSTDGKDNQGSGSTDGKDNQGSGSAGGNANQGNGSADGNTSQVSGSADSNASQGSGSADGNASQGSSVTAKASQGGSVTAKANQGGSVTAKASQGVSLTATVSAAAGADSGSIARAGLSGTSKPGRPASIERHNVPLVSAPEVPVDMQTLMELLAGRQSMLMDISKKSSDLSSLMSNLMDDTSDSAKYSAEIVDNLDILIEDLTALHDSLDTYYPDLQDALDDSKELVARTTEALNNGISTMTIVQNTLKDSSDDFDAAARESLRGSMELLDKSLSIFDSTTAMRQAGRTMKDTIDNELDKFDTDNRFLFMDPSAEKVSFTSDKNRPPKTLQIVLRTDEISVDDDDAKTVDAEVAKAKESPLRRMWNVLVQMWKAMVSIFKNR